MIPVRIAVSGFISYRDPAEVHFDGAKLWMLHGRNGAGKSALFDAITFALYGYGRFGTTNIKEYIHQGCTEMMVEFDFDLNHCRYRVRKTVAQTKPSTYQAFQVDIVNRTTKTIPGTEREAGFKHWIERTLNLNCETFTASVILRQGESEKLLSSKDTERAAIMDQIVNLKSYSALHDHVNELAKFADIQIKGDKKRLAELSDKIEALLNEIVAKIELDKSDYPVKENWLDDAHKLIDALAKIQTDAENEAEHHAKRLLLLAEIAPLMTAWKHNQLAQADVRWKQAAYAVILGKASEIERAAARDQELKIALPLLNSWVGTRTSWHEAHEKARQAKIDQAKAQEAKDKIEAELIVLRSDLKQSQDDYDAAVSALSGAEAHLAVLKKRLDELEKAAGAKECLVCGQPLTPEHIAAEKTQLSGEIAYAQTKVKEAKQDKAKAKERRDQCDTKIKEGDRQKSGYETAIINAMNTLDKAEAAIQTAENTANDLLRRFAEMGDTLAQNMVGDAPYVPQLTPIRLRPTPTTPLQECFDLAGFPTLSELETLRGEQKTLVRASERCKELTQARNEVNKLSGELDGCSLLYSETKKQLTAKLPAAELDTLLAETTTAEQHIEAQIAQFEGYVASMDAQAAEAKYRVEIAALTKRCEALGQKIVFAKADCEEAKTAASDRAKAAQRAQDTLTCDVEAYTTLAAALETNAKHAKILRTLETKLDKNHLQSHLRLTAEKAIVSNAQVILRRLSDSTLELHLADDTDKTLDLRIVDHEKGSRRLLPAALSGSQKFRLSVALALGIGQYACGTRQGGVKSVIIDEGFGSLDREGRERMIEELQNLGRILERIIVVSHQEEFEQAFPYRWRIFMEDGTAKAEMRV